jgi:exocyst complex component 7
LTDLTPLLDASSFAAACSALLAPLVALFSDTLSSLISLIKRSLHKYTFLALAAFATLSTLQPQWDNLLARRLDVKSAARPESNELKEGLFTLRAVCLRSFPEFLADVKLAASGKGESTGLTDITMSVGGGYQFSYFA